MGGAGLMRDTMSTDSIYRLHLGNDYARLPAEVRAFHDLQGRYRLRGEVDVIGAATVWGKLLSLIMRFPASSPRQPFEFHLHAKDGKEVWQRKFPARAMASQMSLRGDFLVESFGPMQCRFILRVDEERLIMEPRGIRYFGLPLPALLLPRINASEHGADGKLYFDVSARWPGKHLMVAYQGWLDVRKAERLE
jgi:hypothetical protein